ncbi:hypothetical protein E0L36_25180 [Streptomyces sp. AJS327]|uniref:hypothetical protein n=1 Tax=Streptomyces sp. AJS327 TaxID=2545265 RepID=UPI0015DED598|nr:hypothetical protein [Streptomyces sp. AJS327]MBA0054023.1 hypothetical protein [Streptomyces sp. AJS327]
MSECLPRGLMGQIAAAEADMAWAADVARALLADHEDLPVAGVHLRRPGEAAEVHLHLPNLATVQAWAGRLRGGLLRRVPIRTTEVAHPWGVRAVLTTADATVSGVRVHLYHCRFLPAPGGEAA